MLPGTVVYRLFNVAADINVRTGEAGAAVCICGQCQKRIIIKGKPDATL